MPKVKKKGCIPINGGKRNGYVSERKQKDGEMGWLVEACLFGKKIWKEMGKGLEGKGGGRLMANSETVILKTGAEENTFLKRQVQGWLPLLPADQTALRP